MKENNAAAQEISCAICRDLMPLVSDGVASAESEQAVHAHLAHCAACRKEWDACAVLPQPVSPDDSRVLRRIRRGMLWRSAAFVLLGLCAGIAAVSLGLGSAPALLWTLIFLGALGYALLRRYIWAAAPAVGVVLGLLARILTGAGLKEMLYVAGFGVIGMSMGAAAAGLLAFALLPGGGTYTDDKREESDNDDETQPIL